MNAEKEGEYRGKRKVNMVYS